MDTRCDDICGPDLPDLGRRERSHLGVEPKVNSLRYLAAMPRPTQKWVIDGLMIAGGISLLAGKPKSGKSTLSRHLAACIADGSDFLGRKVQQGVVLMVPLEDQRDQFLTEISLRSPACDESILVAFEVFGVGHMDWLARAIRKFEPALVIIDTMFRFVNCRDPNSYVDVIHALNPLLQLARSTGTHITLLHHLSKRSREDAADEINGSVGIHGSMDASLIIRVNGGRRTIESQNRYGRPLERSYLQFDRQNMTFDVHDRFDTSESSQIGEAMLAALQCEDRFTEELLLSQVSGSTAAKRAELRRLVRVGSIGREGMGSRGSPFVYRLP